MTVTKSEIHPGKIDEKSVQSCTVQRALICPGAEGHNAVDFSIFLHEDIYDSSFPTYMGRYQYQET
jgi:hypothetical protein